MRGLSIGGKLLWLGAAWVASGGCVNPPPNSSKTSASTTIPKPMEGVNKDPTSKHSWKTENGESFAEFEAASWSGPEVIPGIGPQGSKLWIGCMKGGPAAVVDGVPNFPLNMEAEVGGTWGLLGDSVGPYGLAKHRYPAFKNLGVFLAAIKKNPIVKARWKGPKGRAHEATFTLDAWASYEAKAKAACSGWPK